MRTLRLTHSHDGDAHRVEVAAEVPGVARRTAAARFSFAAEPASLERIRWYLEDYPEGLADDYARGIAGRAERLLRELGEQLFRAMFEASRDTRRLWETLRPGLADTRVEIVTGVAGATALPWELLRDPGDSQPVALRAAALVRAHPQAAQAPRLPARDAATLRVLLVISRPGVRDVAYRSVARRLAGLQATGSDVLQLDVLRPPSFACLVQALDAAQDTGAPYHVVHFDGHGMWGDADDDEWLAKIVPAAAPGAASRWLVSPQRPGAHGYLLFEDLRPGRLQMADGPALGNLLADAGVPLLFLNACRSAHAGAPAAQGPSPADPHGQIRAYGSLAQEVMDAGVAGVVAMRYNVYVGTAARFAADVYAGLLQGQPLGAAVSAGRRRLAGRPAGDLGVRVDDWMVPVAYEAAPLHLLAQAAERDRVVIAAGQAGDRDRAGVLPAAPGHGFHGRDDILLALDRIFVHQRIVLLHGEAGSGKTAAAAEFGRWYQRTGGAPGPVLYTSLSRHATIGGLAAQLAATSAGDLAARRTPQEDVRDEQACLVIGQILRQVPLLWIWDDLGAVPGRPGYPSAWPSSGQQELLAVLRSARDTKARLLLISRGEEQPWLGDLPARVLLPPMPPAERNLLARAGAASYGIHVTGLGPSSPVLTAMGGNPRAIIDLADRAFRAGCTTGAEMEAFVAEAGDPDQ